MNKAHLCLLARVFRVDESALARPDRTARALIKIWARKRYDQDYICRYTGISPHTYAEVYALAGEPIKTSKAPERETVHAA